MKLCHSLVFAVIFLPAFIALAQERTGPQSGEDADPKEETLKGIVVLDVVKSLEGERAGIKPGNVLLNWENGRARGKLRSAFDLSITEAERSPMGRVKLQGLRYGKQKAWILGEDHWGITSRPGMSISVYQPYRKGELLKKY